MRVKILLSILVFAAFGVLYAQNSRVYAQEEVNELPVVPTFPACSNPQGTVKVSYDEGVHGIPGNPSDYSGSDEVRILSGNTLFQCFCSINGDGIQTNWWKVSSLSFDQVEYLLDQGWVYVPNGALWGLDEDPYLAHNSPYECSDPGDDDKDDNHNDDHKDKKKDKKKSGDVLGIGGQVLGLATTGNMPGLLLFLGTGVSSLALFSFLILRKK